MDSMRVHYSMSYAARTEVGTGTG